MPIINNINNVNNIEPKRVTGKLSFQVGDVIQAKVVNVSKVGNEVLVKTSDGWQFSAQVKIPLDMVPNGLVKFKVTGFEDGKLQIVLIPSQVEGEETEEKSIETVLMQQNITSSKGDIQTLKSMVSHDIPLTKENIAEIKTLIDFIEKVSENPEEEDSFIDKYIQSKGNNLDQQEITDINKTLKSFFSELKKASLEDILTLKENGIELNEENLKSFSKVFKEDTGLYKAITQESSNASETEIVPKATIADEEVKTQSSIVSNETIKETTNKVEIPAEKVLLDEEAPNEQKVQIPAENIKINKSEDGTEVAKKTMDFMTQDSNIIDKKPEKEINISNNFVKTPNSVDSKENKIINIILENDLPINKENVTSVKTIIDLKEEILTKPKLEEAVIQKYVESKNETLDSPKGQVLASSIKELFQTIKSEPLKNSFTLIEWNSEGKVEDQQEEMKPSPTLKENHNSDEIKSNVKEEVKSQEIKSNVKQESKSQDIKGNNIKQEDKSVELKGNNVKEEDKTKEIKSNIKLEEKIDNTKNEVVNNKDVKDSVKQVKADIPMLKEIIKNVLKEDVIARETDKIKTHNMVDEVKNQIEQKTDIMKDIIRGIKDGDWAAFKSNINDVKVFNSVSNQYYYMDVPVNINQKEYECKLLIKDDRKKGKRIDSQNLKMFVSVKTINMGKVDAYIKVKARNISIDLKCKDNWIKNFQKDNSMLIETLEKMNYSVSIKVDKKNEDGNIVNTREFFQDSSIGGINTRV